MKKLAAKLRYVAELLENGNIISVYEIEKIVHSFITPINDILPGDVMLMIFKFLLYSPTECTIKNQKKNVLNRSVCMAFMGKRYYDSYKECLFGHSPFLTYKSMKESKKRLSHLIINEFIRLNKSNCTVILWKNDETFFLFLENEVEPAKYVTSMLKTTCLLFPQKITFHNATMAYKTRGVTPYENTIYDYITIENIRKPIRFIDSCPIREICYLS